MIYQKYEKVISALSNWTGNAKRFLLVMLLCGMFYAIPALALTNPIPSYITDGSLFELEGDTPHPLVDANTLVFLPLEAQVATTNGNGWRHEYKIDQPHRLPMGATHEIYTATYTIDMSDGAKSIVAQYHGDSPTLMKLYYADSTEQFVDDDNNPVGDSVGKNGIFDLYVRLRTKDLPGFGEDVFHFGTLEAGDTFDLVVENVYGTVSVTAMGKTVTRELEETPTDYLKFGNYLQAQVTTDTSHAYGGQKCKDLDPPLGFADCYDFLGITKSIVTLTDVSYQRTVDEDYVLPAPDPNAELLNGGFEDTTSLNEWIQEEPVSRSNHYNTGAHSAKIDAAPGRFYQRVEVAANTEYELSVYTKGEGAFGVKGTEHIDDEVTTEIDIVKTFADLGEVWTYQSITFTTGADPLPIYVYGLHGSSGEVRFDDFSLETQALITDNNFCPSGNAAPATVFDLANWRIKVPDTDGTTYSPTELATLNNDFFCLTDDGAMVFYAPVDGGTDGSTYPRSELREMVDPSSSSVGWVISGTHKMNASSTVTLEPSNGKIVIAQVDSLSDDILAKIQWDNDRIRVQLRQINPDGSLGSYENYWFDDQNTSFPVGKTFDWDMTVEDGVLSVTVDGETVTRGFATAPSDYADDEFYFSAGSQPQDNTLDTAGEAGEVIFHSFNLTHLEPLDTSSIYCPSTNAAPATAFDLANWRIKVPDDAGTTYSPTELATLNNEFFCLSDDGAMVMYAPVSGGTDGSTYPRTELREMVDPSDSSVGWIISGTHTMSATSTVTLEPSNGKIVIAQVDGMDENILGKIQWQSGKIKAQLRQINVDGSTGSYADFWFADGAASFPVGTQFSWDMTVADGVLSITVDGETETHDFGMLSATPSVYAADELYFSVGSQPQDNSQDDPEGAQEAGEVLFHSFAVNHGESAEPTGCPGTNGAPATTFDLANWRIKLPDASGTTYSPTELATLDNEFFCLSDDGAMVMYVPVDGGTDGSTYPRTELREMVDPSSSSVGWIITGTHKMSASTTVTQEPSNGKIVIAQVDGIDENILGKIQWQSGKIKAQLRQINVDGSTGSYADFWFAGEAASFPVGTQFDWDMTVENGILSVTVNGETETHDFTQLSTTPSVYVADELYFSAGSQPQDNTLDEVGEAAEVLFYSLDVTHEAPSEPNSCPGTNGAPATVFDLANWRIKLPDVAGTTYSPADLATLDNEFFCLSDDGAMIMHVPVDGGTDGSTYPRTELREMVDPGSSSVGWIISGTHTMSATTTVTQEPSNGKIVIAQVDGMSTSILGKIQWQSGKIKAQLRQINVDGSTGSYADFWFAGEAAAFPVGTPFDWNMTVEDGVLSVTVNGETETHDFTQLSTTPSVYVADELYFSAGSQPQDNTLDEAGEAATVLFHSLHLIHEAPSDPNSCPGTNGAPATVFDLANWRIKLPDVAGTTYSPADLATLDNEFFCLSDDGAMIMHAPVDGGTDGSTYPRTELREMVDPDSSSVGWIISGTHTMSATTTVTQEPSNGKIVIAQVDGMNTSILGKIQWQSGKIKAQLRQINVDGSTGSYADFWFAGEAAAFPVGTPFDWNMTIEDGVLSVTVNGETETHDFTQLSTTPSVYVADELYFSAGSQPQDNTLDESGEAATVLFHSLDVIHVDAVPAVVTISDAMISEGNDAVLVIKLDNVRLSDTTMQVQTVDDTATGGNFFHTGIDYQSVDTIATITAGTLSTTVTIQTMDDADVEGQETLTVTLSNLMGGNVTFADDRARVIITEDDSDDTSVTVTVDPEVDTTLTFSDTEGGETTPVTTIEVPAGAVSETVTLMYNSMSEDADDGSSFEFAGTRFEMTAYVGGTAYEHYTFAAPVRVTLHYSDTQVTDMDEDTLRLQFWTGTDWIDAAATCYDDDPTQVPDDAYTRDAVNNTFSVEICHLTEFATFAEPILYYYFPAIFQGGGE